MDRHDRKTPRSQTLPSSPTHSSSDFEFTVSLSPRKSSPADDLFYKGQLLPLHLSSRISMVRTLLLSSSSASSATTARHSSSSDSHSSFSSACDSSRPSSVTDDDQTKLVLPPISTSTHLFNNHPYTKQNNHFFTFSSVFRKEAKTSSSTSTTTNASGSSVKRMIRKYLKKAKPLYHKLSHKAPHSPKPNEAINSSGCPKRRSCVSSCPSSMRSSPTHSGVLCRNSVVRGTGGIYSSNSSSMEDLQSAIQGAIAHCKSSMTQNK